MVSDRSGRHRQGKADIQLCASVIVHSRIYYAPDYFKEVLYDYWDDVNEKMREKWQDYMGIKGNQRYFKNWTPPGMDPPPAKPEPR